MRLSPLANSPEPRTIGVCGLAAADVSAIAAAAGVVRFGVGLGDTYGRNSDENLPPESVYLELEEHYHMQLLAYALDVFDLTFRWCRHPL